MKCEEWTVTKFSTEFGVDRRTLDRVIADAGVEPVREDPKSRYYRIQDVFEALKYGSDKLDLSQEKALEARERCRRTKRENDLAEELIAPMETLRDALEQVSVQVASNLDALPLNLKKRCPALTARDIEFIKKEIAKCRNAMAAAKI
jgi:phage terminase Nu1 subunit (DNA packaging protein)